MYFYDENLSFFLKDVSLLLKRKHKSISFYGMAVITPDDTAHYHGSKSILRNTERIAHLLRSYFDVPCVLCTGQSKAAALYAYKESSLVIKKDHSVIKCFYTRSETILPAILKSEKATAIGKNSDGASALAKETAYAVGNVCQIVRPQKLYLDGDGVFLLPSFIRSFTEALAEFTCVEECDLPQIICTDGSLPILGANKELRHKYIEFRLNELGD